MTMTSHPISTREEWLAARLELLDAEKDAALGRNEGDLSWFHRHDEYDDPADFEHALSDAAASQRGSRSV